MNRPIVVNFPLTVKWLTECEEYMWLKDQLPKGSYGFSYQPCKIGTVLFYNPEDATAFKLRFSL